LSAVRPTPRQRAASASITALLVAGFGYALIAGLGVATPRVAQQAFAAFDILPPPPPPPPEPIAPDPVADRKPSGAAAPPNLKSHATPVTAPVPIVPITQPPPVTVALTPATGANAPVAGPGTGAGGTGTGTGSGGHGNGSGAGGDAAPEQIAGDLSVRALPRGITEHSRGGTVSVQFVVSRSGRVTDCVIARSSGDPRLDDATCDQIIARFRFEPSRDAAGNPVESIVEENETWAFD
jgi:protein TonB